MNILRTIFSIQASLFASLEEDLDALSEREREFVRIVSLAQMERFTGRWAKGSMGRPRHSREAIARAFVAKALWNFPTTEVAVEYLKGNKNLRRLCGWEHAIDVPSLSTFSRAFAEFAAGNLPGLVHEAMIRETYGEKLAGHVSRDATAIEVRQKPVEKEAAAPKEKHRRARPRKGEVREAKPPKRLDLQPSRTLEENLEDLPTACDVGCKRNSKGYKETWRGLKLHIDSIDGDIPVSAILTSASLHDSQAAIPLAQLTSMRIANCYDLMDSAYDAPQIHAFSRGLGHVPLIDPNLRSKEKVPLAPAEKARFAERSTAERVNSDLKDNHGGRFVRVRGAMKVYAHLMFGIVVIAATQLMRLME
jgi:hypothetical protein